MAGHSRPKDGVASARLCPAIHVLLTERPQDVDAGTSPGMTSKVHWCPTSPAIDGPINPLLLLSANSKTRPGRKIMTKASSIRSVETLSCDAGWRNYHFVKVMTEDGIVGWERIRRRVRRARRRHRNPAAVDADHRPERLPA